MSLSKGTLGAVNEIRVALYMMILGWQLFRSISPNDSVDLVAIKGRTVLKVQVKASFHGQYKHLRSGNNDLLAIVTAGDQIRFRPLFPEVQVAIRRHPV
jgi:hypothetical protein